MKDVWMWLGVLLIGFGAFITLGSFISNMTKSAQESAKIVEQLQILNETMQGIHTIQLLQAQREIEQDLLDLGVTPDEWESYEAPDPELNFTAPEEFDEFDAKYDWIIPSHYNLLDAIEIVESNGDENAIGDNGNALGSFQIWNVYWLDATEHDTTIGGVYDDVRNSDYARRIVLAYWDRYGYNTNYSLEGLARIHNGGPRGYQNPNTDVYWERVEAKILEEYCE